MSTPPQLRPHNTLFVWLQLVIVYTLIECALWSPRTSVRNKWALLATLIVAILILIDRPSIRRLGLGFPGARGASIVLTLSLFAVFVLIASVLRLGGQIDSAAALSNLHGATGYVIWALIQEFLLLSFFFTRCEDLFGGPAAVWSAATLFAAAHIPNFLLTTFAFAGGLFFCEMFRRYRSIYPLAVVHALLGLTVSLTMPDSLMHHMRAGIGFLQY
ncbi:MAG: CPBP family intramembrane glutamic endopeptidase [Terriglobales bacterium]